jgi:hypothetical protein
LGEHTVKYKKALLTVGAVGVLGTAGSFGTFAAFTDAVDAPPQTWTTGNIEVAGAFNLPSIDKLVTGDPVKSGTVTLTNTGDRAEQVWVDQDGPVGNTTEAGSGTSDHVLADNLLVSSSLTIPNPAAGPPTVTYPLDADTRLWKVNRRGLAPLPGPTSTAGNLVPLVLEPGQVATLGFTVDLRERNLGVGETSALDNVMQGQSIQQLLYVRSIEANAASQADFAPDVNAIPFDAGIGVPAGASS